MDTSITDKESPIISDSSYAGNSFNDRLNAAHIDIAEDDESWYANITRVITNGVSTLFSPKQIIVVLRLLKALTFCFLCLTIVADLLYVFFVELGASDEVSVKLGGLRDRICRLYGVVFSVLAIMVELDMNFISKHFPGLKGFLPRGMLLLFVSSISGTSPIIGYEKSHYSKQSKYKNYDDDEAAYYYGMNQVNLISDEISGSVVVFQAMTSFFIFLSACTYLFLGLLCFDRFTSRAFISDDDPVSSTAIDDRRSSRRSNSRYHAHGDYSESEDEM